VNRLVCPYCQAQLNLGGHLILAGTCSENNKGVFLMSDKLGDYSVLYSDNLKMNQGDKVHFSCPACHHSLEYKENKNLAKIIQVDENKEEHTIIFSTIFGEESTYHINEIRTLTFGENALRYMDPDWYRKI
jgi:uncharacterized protein YbaR (Trm112 family)